MLEKMDLYIAKKSAGVVSERRVDPISMPRIPKQLINGMR